MARIYEDLLTDSVTIDDINYWIKRITDMGIDLEEANIEFFAEKEDDYPITIIVVYTDPSK